MVTTKTITVHRRISIALSGLPLKERVEVEKILNSLHSEKLNEEAGRIEAFKPATDLFLFKVTPELRLIFRKTSKGIEILDLVSQTTMDHFGIKANGSRHPGAGKKD